MSYANYYLSKDTIVALATAPGVSAIAVIRISGEKAISIGNKIFKGKNLELQPSHTIAFGNIVEGNTIIDEVLVSIFRAPYSFTKENVIEISCHGSPYIVKKIIQLAIKNGARHAQPGEFTLRAFLNGRFDLAQAEAIADLIAADSEAAHRMAINQMKGGVSKKLKNLREELINFASLIELELDFSEEDVEFANRKQLYELTDKILFEIEELLNSFQLGNAVKTGVSTVIAGRPNAGKSTLLNALLNEERAIVSDIPGTTRDTIEEKLNINGVVFRLVDTAGIREATDAIEAIGVKKTFEKINQSAILIYVFDASVLSLQEVEKDIIALRKKDVPMIIVPNKTDLIPKDKQNFHFSEDFSVVCASARQKENIETLKNELYNLVVNGKSLTDKAIITNARHYEALTNTKNSILRVQQGIIHNLSGDLLSEDIKEALYHLGNISGTIDVDYDILRTIFSRFCIGK